MLIGHGPKGDAMSRRPVFESWGSAVTSCNYVSFKKPAGERERAEYTLPCGRSLCPGCRSRCGGRSVFRFALSRAAWPRALRAAVFAIGPGMFRLHGAAERMKTKDRISNREIRPFVFVAPDGDTRIAGHHPVIPAGRCSRNDRQAGRS